MHKFDILKNNIFIKLFITLLIIVFCISFSDNCFATAEKTYDEETPIYIPPNKNAEKRRLEAGDAEGVNRGVRVRGVRVRGVRVRGVRVRSGTRGGDAFSSGLTDDLSDMLDIEPQKKETNETNEFPFPTRLAPIASEQTGYTSKKQPNLYWYISAPFHGPMEFKLNEPLISKPILSVKLTGFPSEGIYEIKLSDYNIELKSNVEYEWFITIITDAEERSGDIYASATIKYVEPSSSLNTALSHASKDYYYSVYAKNGYWYDAISSLSKLIKGSETIKKYRLHRAALLKQVNLPKAAKYDLSLINVP
ncbi:membrane or secreted protein containing DUF928 [Candidatus Magnetomorum sp. HK-1]|nr:membrane or secreted protein containing DUF928 [Candidatus Magnetomorum sp. HK-1]